MWKKEGQEETVLIGFGTVTSSVEVTKKIREIIPQYETLIGQTSIPKESKEIEKHIMMPHSRDSTFQTFEGNRRCGKKGLLYTMSDEKFNKAGEDKAFKEFFDTFQRKFDIEPNDPPKKPRRIPQ